MLHLGCQGWGHGDAWHGCCQPRFDLPTGINAIEGVAKGRNQSDNVKAVIADVLGHGNEKCMLPGQLEANWAKHVAAAGGLLFSTAEVAAFNEVAVEAKQPTWDVASFKTVTI